MYLRENVKNYLKGVPVMFEFIKMGRNVIFSIPAISGVICKGDKYLIFDEPLPKYFIPEKIQMLTLIILVKGYDNVSRPYNAHLIIDIDGFISLNFLDVLEISSRTTETSLKDPEIMKNHDKGVYLGNIDMPIHKNMSNIINSYLSGDMSNQMINYLVN